MFSCALEWQVSIFGWPFLPNCLLLTLRRPWSRPLLVFHISGLSWMSPQLVAPCAYRQTLALALLRSTSTSASALKKVDSTFHRLSFCVGLGVREFKRHLQHRALRDRSVFRGGLWTLTRSLHRRLRQRTSASQF